jgi:Mrp family chromosome partitioning ATPase
LRPPFAFRTVVQGPAPSSVRLPANAPDLRRAISRQTWLANRAANALRRPAFIGAVSVGTFITAIVATVVVPKAQRQPPVPVVIRPRPDTLALTADAALGRVRLATAESALAVLRADAAAQTATVPPEASVGLLGRDSINARMQRLGALLTRAEQAPLLSSYRALADLPELRSDSRIRALVDTLAEIEREREAFGAMGGVDPVFVALTSRASEAGRAIQSVARQRHDSLASQLQIATAVEAEAVEVPAVDTASFIVTRDSLNGALLNLQQEHERRRAQARALDVLEGRERARVTAVAPTLALLASAFVLSGVIGFAVAFVGELRKPRISNATELERYLGVRVLSTVETSMPSVDRGRREADRAAPSYFDPGAEGYQLAYLGLATEHPTLLMATVTGDDPAIAAVVACTLAAVAADEARNALVLDLEPSGSAATVLRSRATPGVVDIVRHGATWPDATVPARIGRDRTIDLVPYGSGAPLTSPEIVELLTKGSPRLARYYDAILLTAPATQVAEGIPAAVASHDVIFCAQPGLTPLRPLRAQLDRIRNAGGAIRGIVLWAAERPLIPRVGKVNLRSSRRAETEPLTAAT